MEADSLSESVLADGFTLRGSRGTPAYCCFNRTLRFSFVKVSNKALRDACGKFNCPKQPEPVSVLADKSPSVGNKTINTPEQVATTKTNGERGELQTRKVIVVDSKKQENRSESKRRQARPIKFQQQQPRLPALTKRLPLPRSQ